MDVMVSARDAGGMDIESRCPRCGWPDAEPYEIVSRHVTSEGLITWSRCACGRLRVHRGTTVVLRASHPVWD
jgi:hypothetical protein